MLSAGVLFEYVSGLNVGSRIFHWIPAAVDVSCFGLIALFSDVDVDFLVAGRAVEGDRFALLVLLVSTAAGVFGKIWPLNSNGTSVPLLLLLMKRFRDVDICLDLSKEGWSRGMIDFERKIALLYEGDLRT